MNKLELRSYLESIYGISVASVQTQNILGSAHLFFILFFFSCLILLHIFWSYERTRTQMVCVCTGKVKRTKARGVLHKLPDFKLAYVTLVG